VDTPREGDKFQTHSYKHDGRFHRAWHESIMLKASPYVLIGGNAKTMVTESDGRSWWTKEPAICYFHYQNWFNVIGMLREDGIYYYCNISSPYVYNEETVKYIDYDLDIKVFPDMSYIILDEDEYEEHRREMNYPDKIDYILQENMKLLIQWIELKRGPFSSGFVEKWYRKFLQVERRKRKEQTAFPSLLK